MSDLIRFYNDRITLFAAQIKNIQRRINRISVLRLIVFIAGVAISVYIFRISPWLTAASAILFCSVFIFLIITFNRLNEKKDHIFCLKIVNEDELIRLSGDIREFDNGIEFLEADHPYAADLDIFGRGSLFQDMNRTSTVEGKKELANFLLYGTGEKEILLRQSAVAEIKEKTDWRHTFQAFGMMLNETGQEIVEIKIWLDEKDFFLNRPFYRYIVYILPAVTIILLGLSIVLIPVNIPVMMILLQFGIIAINMRKINRQHTVMSKKFNIISKYKSLFEITEKERFQSEKLINLREGLSPENGSASGKMNQFAKLIDRFDRRLNMIVGAVLDGLFLWDIHCIIRLEQWRDLNREAVPVWFSTIAGFDAFISLGGYWFNNPDFVLPVLKQEPGLFSTKDLSHPLLDHSQRISNDFIIEGPGRIMLITGSNMAGKSTFLRSVGVNIILGMAGAPVCASHFEFTPVQVYTSMRIGDSIFHRESTFYAELKRLKQIIEFLESGEKTLILLDEILKGTNSRDKNLGSGVLIKQLINYGASALVATHDLDLCNLESELPDHVKNYSFEVKIEYGHFFFDYKLKKGVCQTMNATELMRQMGIDVAEAKEE